MISWVTSESNAPCQLRWPPGTRTSNPLILGPLFRLVAESCGEQAFPDHERWTFAVALGVQMIMRMVSLQAGLLLSRRQ
jgi:hypothetical protein